MTPQTFAARLYDPATGSTRDVVIEISPVLVAVRLTEPRRRGEDGPHHACADFTSQATEIAAAIVDANEERQELARPYVCPGCQAIGSELHADYCPDAAIERDREERDLDNDAWHNRHDNDDGGPS